jgi:putative ABC transport system substrate-binding protein
MVGAAVAPLAAAAQTRDGMRRVGLLMNLARSDPEANARLAAFSSALAGLGWVEGRNVRTEYRFGDGRPALMRSHAEELVKLAPDVILANASPSVVALRQAASNVPLVFVNVIDPVGAGYVTSLSQPGGHATGFSIFEFGIAEKWLDLLKQTAPAVTRVAVLRDAASPTGIGQFGAVQAASRQFRVELTPIGMAGAQEIERGVAGVAPPGGALLVTPSTSAFAHRDLIVELAARHRLPAIYPFRLFTAAGGLMSYGPNPTEPFERAAGYIDRILKGEKPSELPVQGSSKYDLALNVKTAKALGLELPSKLLFTADEVIE